MTTSLQVELVNKYSKYVKTIKNRIVEVEFYWFQPNPYQSYRLRINENQFNEARLHTRSKRLLTLRFEQFIDLIAPVFANDAAEISPSVLRSTFDHLFDQNSNGKVEQQEFEAILILLQGLNTPKQILFNENLREIFSTRTSHISFKEFYDFVKCGYLRELFMRRTAFIVSSLNDLGLSIARQFAKQNYNVALNENQNDKSMIRTMQNEYHDNRIMSFTSDIQNEIEIYKLVGQILHQFQSIDVLIINHQCKRHYRASIDEFPLEKWQEMIDHNLIRTFALVKTLWPHMKRQHFGRIIHIANQHSLTVSEYQSACTTSHHGLLGLSQALSIEGAPYGITSNVICPGYTQTSAFEQNKQIKTLADLVLFLCTDQARTINGQSIPRNDSI